MGCSKEWDSLIVQPVLAVVTPAPMVFAEILLNRLEGRSLEVVEFMAGAVEELAEHFNTEAVRIEAGLELARIVAGGRADG